MKQSQVQTFHLTTKNNQKLVCKNSQHQSLKLNDFQSWILVDFQRNNCHKNKIWQYETQEVDKLIHRPAENYGM